MIWSESTRDQYEKLPKEELYYRLSVILKEELADKQYLLRLIKEGLSFSIPQDYTYKKIIEKIAKLEKEKEFSTLFQLKDFIEMILVYRNNLILQFFTIDQMRVIGQEFCKLNYDPSSRNSMISSISKNMTEEELTDLFVKINLQKEEKNLVQQSRKWIVGPLGLLRSMQSRSWSGAKELSEILEGYLSNASQFAYFNDVEISGDFTFEKENEKFYKSKCIQLILASFTDGIIIKELNVLVDHEMLDINSIKKFDTIIVSPYGIFEQQYFGFDSLVSQIINSFSNEPDFLDSELKSEGFVRGTIDIRVREECLKKNPKEIIENYFGTGPNLIKLAREIGLVSLRKIQNKEDLLQVILLKLGFTFPPRLDGLITYMAELKRNKAQLETSNDDDLRRGAWNKVYSGMEKISKDLILFFFSCLWKPKLDLFYKKDVKIIKLKEMIQKEFKTKPFDILTFGELCEVLRRINEKIAKDDLFKKEVSLIFERSYIIPPDQMANFDYTRKARTVLTGIHHTTKRNADPKIAYSKFIEICETWSATTKNGRIFPILIRVKEERTNEFGISRSIAIDEKGDEWTLKKSGMWLRPENAYCMLTNAEFVAIEPLMVEKIW